MSRRNSAMRTLPNLLGDRTPITNGSLNIEGVEDVVHIDRDRWGIPHIRATNDADAWFGLGFCQGQDRTFQIESRLRMGRGMLSSLVGPSMLNIDTLCRRIGFRRAAQRQWSKCDPEVKATIQAFCDGHSRGVSDGFNRKPVEYAVLRSEPTPLEPSDVLSFLGIISFMLASNWDSELARLEILRADGVEALTAIEPVYPEWLDTTDPTTARAAGSAIDDLRRDANALLELTGLGSGSNNWAIGGERTASGRPLVANDPHLSPDLPAHWYLSHVTTPDWQAAGASLAGTPGFAVGHNEHLAWGVTAGGIDNTDLFIEELSADGTQARTAQGWTPVDRHQEYVPVRGGRDVTIDVVETPMGSVVSPDLGGGETVLSIRATWLQEVAARGLVTVHRCTSVDQIGAEFAEWPALPLNIVAADDAGHIGWNLVGNAPVRGLGHGIVPQPAWAPDAGWVGVVAPEDMPSAIDPEDGFLATANNKPTNNDTPWLGHDWHDASRANRIRSRLAQGNDWDLDSSAELQNDTVTPVWMSLSDLVVSAEPETSDGRRAHRLLTAWEGDSAPESAAAAVFELFVAELSLRMTRAKAPNSAEWACGASGFSLLPAGSLGSRRIMHLMTTARDQPDGWFNHSWAIEAGRAIDGAVATLVEAAGPDEEDWAWGSVRTLTLQHPLGAALGPLGNMFNRGPFPWGGSAHTVSNGAVNLLDPLGNPMAIANLRMNLEVPDWDNARFSLAGGQSGNPSSPHYDDLLAHWLEGTSVPIAWSAELVQEVTEERMRLLPRNR